MVKFCLSYIKAIVDEIVPHAITSVYGIANTLLRNYKLSSADATSESTPLGTDWSSTAPNKNLKQTFIDTSNNTLVYSPEYKSPFMVTNTSVPISAASEIRFILKAETKNTIAIVYGPNKPTAIVECPNGSVFYTRTPFDGAHLVYWDDGSFISINKLPVTNSDAVINTAVNVSGHSHSISSIDGGIVAEANAVVVRDDAGNIISNGVDKINTGYKLINNNDLGSLFIEKGTTNIAISTTDTNSSNGQNSVTGLALVKSGGELKMIRTWGWVCQCNGNHHCGCCS